MLKRYRVFLGLFVISAIVLFYTSLFMAKYPTANPPLLSPLFIISFVIFFPLANLFLLVVIFGNRIQLFTPKTTEDKEDEQPQPDPDRQILTIFQNGTEIYSHTNVFTYEGADEDGITTVIVRYPDPDDEEIYFCDTVRGHNLSFTYQQINE